MHKTWISSYPARFISMLDYNIIIFDLNLGFDITIRRPIAIDIEQSEHSQRIFLRRRLEHILHAASTITVDVYWAPNHSQVDIDVDNRDLIEMLHGMGCIPDA